MKAGAWAWKAVLGILVVTFLSSCSEIPGTADSPLTTPTGMPTAIPPTPIATAAATSVGATPTLGLVGYAFPSEIDPTALYMFYLHGKIIEDQGIPAISPEFGEYLYEDILRELHSHGFVVISEQRAVDTDSMEYAVRVARQIHQLMDSGVPSGSITVVGASKGAAIAILVSSEVSDTEVNYVLLGGCHTTTIDELIGQGVSLSGNVLAIYDSSDAYAGSCAELFSVSEGKGLASHSEIVVHVGSGHGLLYGPLPDWIIPTVNWAQREVSP